MILILTEQIKEDLNAALSVIYINSDYNVDEGRKMVDSMLKLITYYPKTYPDKFALARNPDEVREEFQQEAVFTSSLS